MRTLRRARADDMDEAALESMRVGVPSVVDARELRDKLEQEVRAMDPADPSLFQELEGYLYKRSQSLLTTWKKRYFFIRGGRLMMYDTAEQKARGVLADVLELESSTAYPFAVENRPGVFQLIVGERSFVLQASDEQAARQWMLQLRLAAKAALASLRFKENQGMVNVIKRHEPKVKKNNNTIIIIIR